MQLNRNKDYGTVMGSDHGVCYVQNEVLFDADGNQCGVDAVHAAELKEALDQAQSTTLTLPKKGNGQLAEQLKG